MTRHYRGPHKPVGDGLCEHRWRNRTTVQVHCGWSDGYRAALVRTPETLEATDVYAAAMLTAWRKTKDFLRDRLLTSGRSDVSINAVLQIMNEALNDPAGSGAASPAPDPGAGLREAIGLIGELVRYLHPWTSIEQGGEVELQDRVKAFLHAALAPSAEPPETRCPNCDSGKRSHRGFAAGDAPIPCGDPWHAAEPPETT